ncbi:hypothetical protein QR680_009428 [Steinernema hermaphroditum]|uniref:CNNM transmembrane domain-containing protein n=1 Tax=Steinernema hermaphroditum TaxID=289476 RepID=A0AA39M8T5_9BILA|nr:hypothetical protein QR680_009428 [Steinernema hermaphroditum]
MESFSRVQIKFSVGFFSVFLIFAFLHFLPSNAREIVISGARPGIGLHDVEISSEQPVEFTIFGENLESLHDFWMTTADRCEDAKVLEKTIVNLTSLSDISDGFARVVASEDGVPENTVEKYRVCTDGNVTDGLGASTLTVVSRDEARERPIPLYALILLYVALIWLSALFSGLNLAFMCVTLNELTLIEQSGDELESVSARKIIPLRKRANWLICTFATGNAVANIGCTIFMELMWKGHSARTMLIATSTLPVVFTVLFAEIIPQTICNRRGLCVASKTRYVTMFFMGLFAPFTFPISKILDWTLGTQGVEIYDRGRISAMIKLQADTKENGIPGDIIQRAFNLPMITVGTVMTPINDAFLLSTNDVLDKQRMILIMEKGYTRIPVYEGHNRGKVVAILNVKDLVFAQPEKKQKVGEICDKMNYGRQVRFVTEEMRARPLMSEMIKGHQHLAMVVRYAQKSYLLVGLITLEDIIEEIVGEIQDDTDASWTNQRAGLHRDQATLDWLRAPVNPLVPLSTNEQLELIQYLMRMCPAFARLSLNLHAMLKILNSSRVFHTGNEMVKVLSRGDKVRSIFVLCSGQATYGSEACGGHGKEIFGAGIVEDLFEKYVREGVHADVSGGYASPHDLWILKGSVFLKMRLETILEVLIRSQNEKWQREIVEGADCYFNNLTTNSQSAGSSGERILAALKMSFNSTLNSTVIDGSTISETRTETLGHSTSKAENSNVRTKSLSKRKDKHSPAPSREVGVGGSTSRGLEQKTQADSVTDRAPSKDSRDDEGKQSSRNHEEIGPFVRSRTQ